MKATSQLRAIMFKDGDMWVAQCLEHDIGAQGKDLPELVDRLALTIEAELRESIASHGGPFVGIDPAPQHFHAMWDRRSGEYVPTEPHRIQFKIDGLKEIPLDLALRA